MARHSSFGLRRVAVAVASLLGFSILSVGATVGTAAAAPATL